MRLFHSQQRCAIVLAGGAGLRMEPFVHQLRGNSLPKQYVNIIGTRSMLQHAFARAEKLIPQERIFTVVSRNHLRYADARRQLSDRPKGTVVIQPENRDTGAGILLPLMHLYKRYPDSTVALFPSDHFIVEEDLFATYVELAFLVAEANPSMIVLLGVEPDRREPEYGYILPDGKIEELGTLGLRNVQMFVEKPDPTLAGELIAKGGLWNTMVMVFKSATLLELVRRLAPELYATFERIFSAIGRTDERRVVTETYRRMEPVNFSGAVLEALALLRPLCLSALPVAGVFWSDWDTEHRIFRSLKRVGYLNRLQGVSENEIFQIWSNS
jgi:mannose-1-phosphate guanylyltransferase